MDFLFLYWQTTAAIPNVRSISNDKKNHQKLCSPVKRGTLTMKLAEHSALRKDGCDSLAYAILTRASTKITRMLSFKKCFRWRRKHDQCWRIPRSLFMLFSNIHVLVVAIGRNTTAIADMDPGSVALNGLAGRICWKDRTFYKPLSPPGHLDINWPPFAT